MNALVPELYCADMAVSRAFYVEILRFRALYERPERGFCYLEREGAELMLEQWAHDGWVRGRRRAPVGHGVHLQIRTAKLAELHDRCAAHGVAIFPPWEEAWYRAGAHYVGQAQFVLADPDGYLLRFVEPIGQSRMRPATGRVVG